MNSMKENRNYLIKNRAEGSEKSLMTGKCIFDLFPVVSVFVNLSGIRKTAVVVYLNHLDQLQTAVRTVYIEVSLGFIIFAFY